MLKRGLIGLAVLASLAGGANSDVTFPRSGVWTQPRLKEPNGPLVVDYDNVPQGYYELKAKVIGEPFETSTGNLIMDVAGPQTFHYDFKQITLPASGESIRYQTEIFTLPGEHTLSYTLGSEVISRDFTIIPEPASLLLFASAATGVIALNKKRR